MYYHSCNFEKIMGSSVSISDVIDFTMSERMLIVTAYDTELGEYREKLYQKVMLKRRVPEITLNNAEYAKESALLKQLCRSISKNQKTIPGFGTCNPDVSEFVKQALISLGVGTFTGYLETYQSRSIKVGVPFGFGISAVNKRNVYKSAHYYIMNSMNHFVHNQYFGAMLVTTNYGRVGKLPLRDVKSTFPKYADGTWKLQQPTRGKSCSYVPLGKSYEENTKATILYYAGIIPAVKIKMIYVPAYMNEKNVRIPEYVCVLYSTPGYTYNHTNTCYYSQTWRLSKNHSQAKLEKLKKSMAKCFSYSVNDTNLIEKSVNTIVNHIKRRVQDIFIDVELLTQLGIDTFDPYVSYSILVDKINQLIGRNGKSILASTVFPIIANAIPANMEVPSLPGSLDIIGDNLKKIFKTFNPENKSHQGIQVSSFSTIESIPIHTKQEINHMMKNFYTEFARKYPRIGFEPTAMQQANWTQLLNLDDKIESNSLMVSWKFNGYNHKSLYPNRSYCVRNQVGECDDNYFATIYLNTRSDFNRNKNSVTLIDNIDLTFITSTTPLITPTVQNDPTVSTAPVAPTVSTAPVAPTVSTAPVAPTVSTASVTPTVSTAPVAPMIRSYTTPLEVKHNVITRTRTDFASVKIINFSKHVSDNGDRKKADKAILRVVKRIDIVDNACARDEVDISKLPIIGTQSIDVSDALTKILRLRR